MSILTIILDMGATLLILVVSVCIFPIALAVATMLGMLAFIAEFFIGLIDLIIDIWD